MTKRKNDNDNDNSNKKPKIEFISPSSLKNYMHNDPIIDYLSYWHINDIKQKPDKNRRFVKNNNEFLNYLFDNGINFEKNIIDKIKEYHSVIQVYNNISDLNIDNFELTKKYLLEGKNIIAQGVLYNFKNNTYGIADLLVKSTYINKLVPDTIEKSEELINKKFYYFAIDIKNSTIELNKDGKYVLNSGNLPFYKVQLLLYTQALSNIFNINIKKSFLLGKRYHWGTKYYENNSLAKLGVIDYENIDFSYYEKFNNSLLWINNVRNNGNKWKLLPQPSIPELYPNMKNKNDSFWRPIKNQLANKINEITQIWNVGVKHRNIAHSKKIYNWKNKKCNSKILGFSEESTVGPIVDAIMDINRNTRNKIYPNTINYNNNNWKTCDPDTLEFYIDYETITTEYHSYIFMIGVGYINNKSDTINKWTFKNFYLSELSDNAFKLMIDNFWLYINNILKEKNKKNSRFIHWTKAEPSQYNKCIDKFMLPNKNFIDLFDVFKNEPIVIKGAFGFSLKDISKAMYKNKMIETCWSNLDNTENKCENGLDALYLAIKLYNENTAIDKDNNILLTIQNYNEVDCKVLYEIIEYLRKYHI